MPFDIRRASVEDLPRIRQFYADRQYGGGVQPQDTVLVAEVDGGLVGLVRLAPEHGTLVLRGMQVHPSFQRQGIGTRILAVLADELGEQPCFCIPYAHLTDFYARIGFGASEPERAPPFLAERLESYRARGDGKEYVLMHRPATGLVPGATPAASARAGAGHLPERRPAVNR
jgi:N-acetylglutamate synthase-like GNAT family acetyltransferase